MRGGGLVACGATRQEARYGGSRAPDVLSPPMRKRHALLSLALAAAVALLALVAPAPARAAEPSFWSDDGVRAEAYASKDDAAQTITISTYCAVTPSPSGT